MNIAKLFDPRRIAAAAAFTLCWTLVLAIFQALDRDIDVAELAASALGIGLVGYLIWPILGDSLARMDRREIGKRSLVMGVGLAAGFALTRVVSVLAGENEAQWSIVVWAICVVGIVVLGVRMLRRTTGS